jgi:hypothetical protein
VATTQVFARNNALRFAYGNQIVGRRTVILAGSKHNSNRLNRSGCAVLVADVIESADVGMVQAGNGASLALEAFAQLGPVCETHGQHLDGDDTVEARVSGAV